MVIRGTGCRQCGLSPIKWPWLCRNGVSFPTRGLFGESLAREASSCSVGGVGCGSFRGCPLRGGPAGRASVLLPPCQELVEFYQQNSLKDCFKSLDTTLQFPFKEPERRAISKPTGRMHQAGAAAPAPSHRGEKAGGCHGHSFQWAWGGPICESAGTLPGWVRGYEFILGKMRTLGSSRVLPCTL